MQLLNNVRTPRDLQRTTRTVTTLFPPRFFSLPKIADLSYQNYIPKNAGMVYKLIKKFLLLGYEVLICQLELRFSLVDLQGYSCFNKDYHRLTIWTACWKSILHCIFSCSFVLYSLMLTLKVFVLQCLLLPPENFFLSDPPRSGGFCHLKIPVVTLYIYYVCVCIYMWAMHADNHALCVLCWWWTQTDAMASELFLLYITDWDQISGPDIDDTALWGTTIL